METYDGSKYYHNIPGLMIPKTNRLHSQVDADINGYIDGLPGIVSDIEFSLKHHDLNKQYISLSKSINMLKTLLNSVYARGLEASAMRLVRHLQDGTPIDQIKEMIHPFIKELLSLSVAMQRAQNPYFIEEQKEVSEIDAQANSTKDLSIVMNLIDDSDFEAALRITSELINHSSGDEGLITLLELITEKQYIAAKNHILKLRGQYSKTVDKLAGVDFSKTVLAVDDMPPVLLYINNALGNHYKVIAVINGKTALEALETQTPDLFLFDIEMPGMDGFTLAKIIRDNAIYAHIPIIFFTGNSAREYVATALAIGNSELLVKPLSHDELLSAVSRYLHS